jgi:hypothetical protein
VTTTRAVLGGWSVAIIAVVVFTASAVGPGNMRLWLLLCSAIAVGAALQSVALDPPDLTTALLFSLGPLLGLLADGSPAWLIGPLAALLLLAAELNALSWACQADGSMNARHQRRLRSAGWLAALAFAAASVVSAVAHVPAAGGTLSLILAVALLAALGGWLFPRTKAG